MAKAEEIGYHLDKKTAETKFKRNEEGEIINDEEENPLLETDIPAYNSSSFLLKSP